MKKKDKQVLMITDLNVGNGDDGLWPNGEEQLGLAKKDPMERSKRPYGTESQKGLEILV